jgi:hypothetical protein
MRRFGAKRIFDLLTLEGAQPARRLSDKALAKSEAMAKKGPRALLKTGDVPPAQAPANLRLVDRFEPHYSRPARWRNFSSGSMRRGAR